MQPNFYYYESGKKYYREVPNEMEEVVRDNCTGLQASSSTAVQEDEYVWTLRYKQDTVAKFVDSLQNGKAKNVHQAYQKSHIGKSTAYRLKDMMIANPDVTPGLKPRNEVQSIELSIEQKSFLAAYVEHYGPRVVLKEVISAFIKNFRDCVPTEIPEEDRSLVYEEWVKFLRALRDNQVDYGKNCVFLDGCKLSKDEVKIATKESKKKKDTFISLGSFVFAGSVSSTAMKKRPNVEMVGPAQGTRLDHFRLFVAEVIRILEERQQTGLYFVMENFSWSSDRKVIEAIVKAGHTPVIVPTKSTFLIPSIAFWQKVKNEVRKAPFRSPKDDLVERIKQVVCSISHSDCQTWIAECMMMFEDYHPQE
ncbi:hypothetical protein BJV82DRAFT_676205 [Fennellomyces sp. T-0311]|nr:hypothetical protein BJV82DRAFT_676205 [Fennellomyces sp. T-0311]